MNMTKIYLKQDKIYFNVSNDLYIIFKFFKIFDLHIIKNLIILLLRYIHYVIPFEKYNDF